MTNMVIGVAAGIFVALMCMIFYTKGVRDGMDVKRGVRPKAKSVAAGEAQDNAAMSEMGKKFETIFNYDPYQSDKLPYDGREGESI